MPARRWQTAVTIVSVLVLGACLPGCAVGESDEDLVASQVKTIEGGAVDVTSCEQVGEAITRESEYGVSLNEAWKCSVEPAGSEPVESCFAVYDDLELGVIGRVDCASLGRGCPPGGRRRADGSIFLGSITHPDLALEKARGNDAPQRTVRVDVSRDANGAPERCGYLDVQLPTDADDPPALAIERVEAHGWSEDRYSLSSRALDG